MKKRGKKAQAWVETVVYTLIGLSIIGIIIGVATPKIKEMTDNAIVEQTITAMSQLDSKIVSTQSAVGNSRQADFRIKKGEMLIDGKEDKIYFIVTDTTLLFSQPGTPISYGDISILTEEVGKKYNINLILDYSGIYDIKFNGADDVEKLTSAPTIYQILMENQGEKVIDFTVI